MINGLKAVFSALLLAALTGCGVSSTDLSVQGALPSLSLPAAMADPTQPSAQYVCVSGAVDFAQPGAPKCDQSVAIGATASVVLLVKNTGTVPLLITAVSVVQASGGTFGQTSDCTAGPVPAYGTCSITITFAPSIIGTAQATLCFTSNSAYGQASNPLCPAASSASYGIQSITLLGVGEAPVVPAVVGQLPGATFSPPPALFKEIPLGNKIPAIAEHGSITLQALEGGLAALRYPVADRTVRQLILSAAGPVLPTALVGVSPERASTYEERMMIRAPEAMLQFQPTSNAQGVSRFAMQRFVAGPSGFIALDATARVWTDASAGSDLAATAVYERSADVWYVAVQRAEVSSTTRQSVTVYRLAARMAIPTPRVVGRYTRTLSRALAMSSEAFVPGSRALAAALTCDGSLYVSGVFEGEDGLEGLQVLQMPVMEPTC